jgi:hypothetical protein
MTLQNLRITHLMKGYVIGIGNKKPKSRVQKERQRLSYRIEKEKDEDINRELKKGNIVEIIEDSLIGY